jgi:DNA-binding transcriptional ArsR family regulator
LQNTLQDGLGAPSFASESATRRATAGTVKPAILKIIQDSVEGITAADIHERTGFRPNSVRGTLSTLRTEGLIYKKKDLWFAVSSEA